MSVCGDAGSLIYQYHKCQNVPILHNIPFKTAMWDMGQVHCGICEPRLQVSPITTRCRPHEGEQETTSQPIPCLQTAASRWTAQLIHNRAPHISWDIFTVYFVLRRLDNYRETLILVNMPEIISIQTGQCGNQIGAQVSVTCDISSWDFILIFYEFIQCAQGFIVRNFYLFLYFLFILSIYIYTYIHVCVCSKSSFDLDNDLSFIWLQTII